MLILSVIISRAFSDVVWDLSAISVIECCLGVISAHLRGMPRRFRNETQSCSSDQSQGGQGRVLLQKTSSSSFYSAESFPSSVRRKTHKESDFRILIPGDSILMQPVGVNYLFFLRLFQECESHPPKERVSPRYKESLSSCDC